MKRIILVSLLAALLSLGVTGLRVVLLQHIATPATAPGGPQPVKDPLPPAERPIEYVAGASALHLRLDAGTALLWPGSAAPRSRAQAQAE
ncbi:MAG TPA: hypothetical protein VKB51_07885 [bacterium]|nr:hypothetical protein [bacterium]